ncbi:serine/threonine-protein kinase HipA [Bradyrhizobium macuxiense]|uniref:Serine/threonine-protein kinase HipA n=1 Tax=Bradyrhizobium macuxiense TaxID=1755647 RepID=A0A560LCF0_9BRAD|nr:type II toxin-antitoxin system HipA family toxin [Bradyrhizobium macuxiense]TWB93032.1 serine/threonine-protein kinase HipA [Bradyrhizobium macuxiense]
MKKAKAADGKPFQGVQKLSVSLDFYGEKIDVGTLAWSKDERRAYFEYHPDFAEKRLNVSPFKLPVSEGAKAAPNSPFAGLHGMLNDSLPDGWGRLLLDRYLQKLGYDFRLLTPLDRLAYVGQVGMGALRYVPDNSLSKTDDAAIDLDWFAAQAEAVQGEVDEADVDRLLEIQGGSAGVRPKIMIGLNRKTGKFVADDGTDLPEGFDAWLVKFKSNVDPSEIGKEEYAYSLMAKAAGVDMPATKLIETKKGSYFAVQRFDRTESGSAHVQTVSGLLEADHRAPSIDYDTLLKVTRLLTRDERHVRQMFVRMVFNVLAHNRDDHAKNHAFLMAKDGVWHPTPAYDLTLSEGPGGEHNLAVDGEGKNPTKKHILKVAENASIPRAEAEQVFEQVQRAVDRWAEYAKEAGLSERRLQEIDRLLNKRGPTTAPDVDISPSP